MLEKSIYRFLNRIVILINVITMVASVYVAIFCDSLPVGIIGMLYAAVIATFFMALKKYRSMGVFLLTIWIQIVGPLELLLLQIDEVSVVGIFLYRLSNGFKPSMKRIEYYWLYFFHSIIMYLLLSVFCVVAQRLLQGVRTPRIKGGCFLGVGQIIKKNVFILLPIFSLVTYVFRKVFSLDIPEMIPTIKFAGLFVYGFQALGLLLLYFAFSGEAGGTHRTTIVAGIRLVLACLIYGLPSVIFDQRAPVLIAIMVLGLYIFSSQKETMIRFLKRNKALMGLILIMILVFYNLMTTYIRYGGSYHVPFLYFFSRIVGIAPSLIFYDHIISIDSSNLQRFNLLNYVNNTIGERNMSASRLFTRDILGFPEGAMHLSSIPPFLAAQLYQGFIGLFVISAVFGTLFAFGETMMIKQRIGFARFIGCYFTTRLALVFMGGGIEQMIELFTVPIMTTVLYIIIN